MTSQPHANDDDRAGVDQARIPHPELALPVPKLTYDFRMSVELNPKVGVGIVPSGGMRNWISFSGGSWAARWGSGTVVPGGQDSQIIDQRRTPSRWKPYTS
ncbi:hypothetical protein GGR55DRAFT_656798 [Xylaria sp. FL0064]|nr:hypothetical protein GGR55DRAFT_656798 [Xylaria sp. FL0064]